MSVYITWGTLSALLIAMSLWQYMWGVYRRDVPRPLISTWTMWSILGLLLLIAYKNAGARMDTTLPAAWMGFINPVIILLLTLRYGEFTWTRLDTSCVIIFAMTVTSWYVFESPLIGLFGGIIADFISAVPQIRKNWMEPHDEIWQPWSLFCLGSAVNLLAIEQWDFGQWLYPMYMTTTSMSLALPLILHRMGLYNPRTKAA